MEIDNLKCNKIAPCIFNENALQNVTSIFSSNKPLSKNFMNFRYVMCISSFFSRNYIWFGPYIFFHRLQNNPSCWQTNNTNDVRKVNKIWTCLSCNRSYEDQRTSENLIKCEPMPANFQHIAAIFFFRWNPACALNIRHLNLLNCRVK